MSAGDDDIDALLDDCLDDFEHQQHEAEIKATQKANERAISAKILEDTLQSTGGDAVNSGAASNDGSPEQLTQMFSQLATILQQTQQLTDAPEGANSAEQEEKLLQMAKQLIGHAQSSVDNDEERQKMASTMNALNRVQELTKQMANAKDENGNPLPEDPAARAELERISSELQHTVKTEHAEFAKNAGSAAEELGKNTNKESAAGNNGSSVPVPDTTTMSDEERKRFEQMMAQIMLSASNPNPDTAASGAASSSSSSSAQQQTEAPQLTPEQQAAFFAMMAQMNAGQQQQQSSSSTNQQQEGATSSTNPLGGYMSMIFSKFESISSQYEKYFGDDEDEESTSSSTMKKAKHDLETGKITDADMARFKEQHQVVKQLLKFKDEFDKNGESVSQEDHAQELNRIVDRLKSLGDPPVGFDV